MYQSFQNFCWLLGVTLMAALLIFLFAPHASKKLETGASEMVSVAPEPNLNSTSVPEVSSVNSFPLAEAAEHSSEPTSSPPLAITDEEAVAYSSWARSEPEEAALAAFKIFPAERRETLLKLIANIWAANDFTNALNFALRVNDTAERTIFLDETLPRWVAADAVSAAQWLNSMVAGSELDAGVEAIALSPDLASEKPDVAARWAANIFSDERRRVTLASVLAAWSVNDPASAQRYLAENALLDAHETANLRSMFSDASAP
jgi:hypothetical protein